MSHREKGVSRLVEPHVPVAIFIQTYLLSRRKARRRTPSHPPFASRDPAGAIGYDHGQ
jgi:hypothetical protein